ncbi:MAG TPA: permease, partial [Allocoleopsis sp.]
MNQLNHAFTLFLSLLVEAMPFLLLGVLFSSALLLFIDENKLISILPRNPFLGALIGSCIGFLFPVCECGNVPVARRLLLQGAPTSVAIGFLLAAPTINPIVIWSTWIAFRDQPEIVFLRVLFSLIIATIVGWVFSSKQDIKHLLQPSLLKAKIIT